MSAPDLDTDVVLLGAGPAGCSAALWLRDFSIPFQWFDPGGVAGGTLLRVHNRIENYPGQCFDSGQPLADALQGQIEALALKIQPERIQSIDLSDDFPLLQAGQQSLRARRVLLATGTTYRTLGVPGESEGYGRYISQSSARDAHLVKGHNVAVVGGGDAAFENALRLAAVQARVSLLLRSTPRAREEFQSAVAEHPNIAVYPIPTVITAISPRTDGCRLHLSGRSGADTLEVSRLFVRIGVAPQYPDGLSSLRRTQEGYLLVNPDGQSSSPLVFGAGDLIDTPLRSIITSGGSGAQAARGIARSLNYL